MSDAPLAYFPLDGDTADHSGNGFDAVAQFVGNAAGVVGGALHFDGSSTMHISKGNAVLHGARTLCAWAKPAATFGLGQPIFFGGFPSDGDFFSISASSPSGGTCTFLPGKQLFVDHWGTPCFHPQTLAVNVDAWSFVCFAHDGAQITFGLDGAAQSTPGIVYDYPLTSLYIGSTSAAGTTTQGSFVGDLDEVTVWSTALSAADMASLWNGGAGCVVR